MDRFTFRLEDGSEVTFYERAVACIQWRRDDIPARRLPDRCKVIFLNGQTLDLLRDNTRVLYQAMDLVDEK